MRIACALILLLCLASCGGGHGLGSALRRTITPTGEAGLDFGTTPVDSKLASAVQQTMDGRQLGLGLFHDFTTGSEKADVTDGQDVSSFLPSLPDALKHGTLRLSGSSAIYTEEIASPNPALTGLTLRGTFDANQLGSLVKQVVRLPFDLHGHTRPDVPPLTVNWQLSGDFVGVPFSVDFDQRFIIDKSDLALPL